MSLPGKLNDERFLLICATVVPITLALIIVGISQLMT